MVPGTFLNEFTPWKEKDCPSMNKIQKRLRKKNGAYIARKYIGWRAPSASGNGYFLFQNQSFISMPMPQTKIVWKMIMKTIGTVKFRYPLTVLNMLSTIIEGGLLAARAISDKGTPCSTR